MSLLIDDIRSSLQESYGESVTSAEIRAWCAMNGTNYQTVTKKLDQFKVGRGKWNLTVQEKLEQNFQAPAAMPAIEQNLIPQKDDSFVQFGNFSDVKKIIQSRVFYPTFITGLSGNGKTFSVEQACAQLGRELIRVNITIETDEDDLIGGFRLVDGATVWHNGPVVKPSPGVPFCFLTKSTLHRTKFFVYNRSLKVRVFSSRRLARSLRLRRDSRFSPLQTRRVRVPMTVDLLGLTCSTKHF